jgi:hypothetical protein
LPPRPRTAQPSLQQYEVVDYRTSKVELPARASRTDFFDLGALLDWKGEEEEGGYGSALAARTVPDNFYPVLTFTDSYGNDLHCDEEGAHAGPPYRYPHRRELEASAAHLRFSKALTVSRRSMARLGWKRSEIEHRPTVND